MTPEDWFDLIEKRGPALRAAGVLVFRMDGVEFQLAPPEPQFPDAPAAAGEPVVDPPNPLDNPALYPDGVVPGYTLHPEDP